MTTNPQDAVTGCLHGATVDIDKKGLTKREYFAAMAMQGLLGADKNVQSAGIVTLSVQLADALIAELNK